MLSPTLAALPASITEQPALAYALFLTLIVVMLALDLGVFHRRAHVVTMRESLKWTAVWIGVAVAFGALVHPLYANNTFGLGLRVPVLGAAGETTTLAAADAVKLWFTAYVIEKSLAMDNVFVIAVIFASLGIPGAYQHRILFWGILGALVMRAIMIFLGVALIQQFSWIVYVFGALLIGTAAKMAFVSHDAIDPATSRVVRALRRVMPVSDRLHGQRFIVRDAGRLVATPLFVALLLVECTDLIFAVDSIPAVFAVTADPFIVFTSNIMAILGLRALYFCLAALVRRFRFLKPALIAILLFAGVKMCLAHTPLKIPTDLSLVVVLSLLALGVGVSFLVERRDARRRARAEIAHAA